MERSNTRITGWNGIWSNGSDSTDLIIKDLDGLGYETEDINYPRVRGVFDAWFDARTSDSALKILDHHQYGDCAIAHSYGCKILQRTMELGAQYNHVFLFSPAMDGDETFPTYGAETITVFHHPRDRMIFLGMILPFHPFGSMGRYGYIGKKDSRIENVNYADVAEFSTLTNHGVYFKDEVRHRFVQMIDNRIVNDERMKDMLRKAW